jgi:G3E family GTPase
MSSRIPVTVLVGFLGSGKTTLLNNLLNQQQDKKIAVIVNEFGAINIDSKLIKHATETTIEMTNGCICCTLRSDLRDALTELAQQGNIDHIVIESTGIGEPLPIAQTFYMAKLQQEVRLDAIVTLVDAATFWDRFNAAPEHDPDSLAPLLIDQVEFTNIIVLNKCDLVDSAARAQLIHFLKQLNPNAKIIETEHARVSVTELLDTYSFNYETSLYHDKWSEEWQKDGSEAEEYGFTSFIYAPQNPFTWEKFEHFMTVAWPENIIRSKGLLTFADKPPAIFNHVGKTGTLEFLEGIGGIQDSNYLPALAADPELKTEIVCIGQHLHAEQIASQLNKLLYT